MFFAYMPIHVVALQADFNIYSWLSVFSLFCYFCEKTYQEVKELKKTGYDILAYWNIGANVFENIMLLFLLADFTVIVLINFTESEINV